MMISCTSINSTGAYGGNKVLMAILQVVAARLAQVDKLVYHTFERQYSDAYKYDEHPPCDGVGVCVNRPYSSINAFREGITLLDEALVPDGRQIDLHELVGKLTEKQFRWGQSDGN